jgi:hypothetical protein
MLMNKVSRLGCAWCKKPNHDVGGCPRVLGKCRKCFLPETECLKEGGYCKSRVPIRNIKICLICGLPFSYHKGIVNGNLTNCSGGTAKDCKSVARDCLLPSIWWSRRREDVWARVSRNLNVPYDIDDSSFRKWLYESSQEDKLPNLLKAFEAFNSDIWNM